jgi:large subunit ribosomal protein L5e
VVRFTNKDIIVQIVYARLQGDFVLTAAHSKELPRYGINHGLTNWAAGADPVPNRSFDLLLKLAYATGLLCSRRALTKLGLADKYEGVAEPDGTYKLTEILDEDAPRPFKCYLDVGLKRTSTGSRVFGAMKGASDGGIFIPHSEKRFPGYDQESKELDAETLKKYIFGGHVAEYMESLEEEDDERYATIYAVDCKRAECCSDSRNNSPRILQMALAQRIWRKSTLMHMRQSGRTPSSNLLTSRKTGSRKV